MTSSPGTRMLFEYYGESRPGTRSWEFSEVECMRMEEDERSGNGRRRINWRRRSSRIRVGCAFSPSHRPRFDMRLRRGWRANQKRFDVGSSRSHDSREKERLVREKVRMGLAVVAWWRCSGASHVRNAGPGGRETSTTSLVRKSPKNLATGGTWPRASTGSRVVVVVVEAVVRGGARWLEGSHRQPDSNKRDSGPTSRQQKATKRPGSAR
jgi:hypothetical protein